MQPSQETIRIPACLLSAKRSNGRERHWEEVKLSVPNTEAKGKVDHEYKRADEALQPGAEPL